MDNQLVCQLTLMGSSIKEHFYYIVYKKKNPPTQKRGDAISRFDVKDTQISLLLVSTGFLLVTTKLGCSVFVDPVLFSCLADKRIVCRAYSFKGDHTEVFQLVVFAIEVTPRWGIHLLIGHVAFVLVKSLLCFPLRFSNVNPGWALVAKGWNGSSKGWNENHV